MAEERGANMSVPGRGSFSTGELAAIAGDVSTLFPQPFVGTDLVLMVVDPLNVHACWHVRPEDMDRARAAAGSTDAPLVLRVYDITFIDFSHTSAHGYFDVQVHGLQNNWYIHLWEDAKSYVADLGLRRADGSLVALARSNVVETPRRAQSSDYGRAGVVLEPGGAVRHVPDMSALPAPSRDGVPTQAMARDEVRGLLRRYYRRLLADGRPGGGPL